MSLKIALLSGTFAFSLVCLPAQAEPSAELPEGWILEASGKHAITIIPETHYPTRYENEPPRRRALEAHVRKVDLLGIEGSANFLSAVDHCSDSTDFSRSTLVQAARSAWVTAVNPNVASSEMLSLLPSSNVMLMLGALTLAEMEVQAGPVDDSALFRRRLSRANMVKGLRPSPASFLESEGHQKQWCSAPLRSREQRLAAHYSLLAEWALAYRRLAAGDKSAEEFFAAEERFAFRGFLEAIRCVGQRPACSSNECTAFSVWQAVSARCDVPDAHALRTSMGFRNEEMTQKLLEMSQKGSVLAVVGALHVASFEVDGRVEKGLLQRLEEAGYRASPLYLCGSAYCKKPVGKRSSARSLGAQPATGLSSGAGQ